MNASEVLKLFADPVMVKTLEWPDLTSGIIITTLLGMGVTFIVLALLQVATMMMSKVMVVHRAVVENDGAAAEEAVSVRSAAFSIEDELAAVITSAVAAVMGKSAGEIVIKKVKQV